MMMKNLKKNMVFLLKSQIEQKCKSIAETTRYVKKMEMAFGIFVNGKCVKSGWYKQIRGIVMIITISLSKSDLERIHNVLGIKSYDDIHTAFVDAMDIMLEKEEKFNDENN